ncbi:MAG: helix-turn-helix transcriptional regulator [Brumimicrobium sp.]|nr:helix-turn-helix transcriptional regulator [Brumimicrobium sp.]
MAIQDRLQMIMKMNNLTSSAFADKVGVQRSSVSHVISGRNKPSLDFIEKILTAFPRVNADWLVTGKQIGKENLNREEYDSRETTNSGESGHTEATNPERQEQDSTKTKSLSVPFSSVRKEVVKVLIFYNDGTFEEVQANRK